MIGCILFIFPQDASSVLPSLAFRSCLAFAGIDRNDGGNGSENCNPLAYWKRKALHPQESLEVCFDQGWVPPQSGPGCRGGEGVIRLLPYPQTPQFYRGTSHKAGPIRFLPRTSH